MLLNLETKPADIQTVLPENEELTCNPIVATNSAEEHCLSDMPLQTESSNAGMFYIQPRAAVSLSLLNLLLAIQIHQWKVL